MLLVPLFFCCIERERIKFELIAIKSWVLHIEMFILILSSYEKAKNGNKNQFSIQAALNFIFIVV